MNPQNPGQPIQPAPTQQSLQGVTSVAPIGAPTMPQNPTGPTPQPLPQPLQNPSYDPTASMKTIADYYQIPREQALNVAQTQAQGNIAGQQVAAQKYQTGVKIQNLQDQLNPSKYRVTQDPGSQYGVNIMDSLGNKVDLGTYVNLTGSNPAEVLSKSTDPGAQQFVQAYNNFEDLMQTTLAASSGDQEAKIKLGEYYSANPGLEKMKPQDVSNLFMQRYGQFFGMPPRQAPNTQGVTPAFTSQNNPIAQSPYYQLANYPQLNQPNPVTNQLLSGQSGSSPDYTGLVNQLIGQGATPPGG